ncbi:MAG TPA: AraC family transcriptional regulator [Rugosimonospora sp.]|nr:AraC family transcriptional regulator [Rugosimonospora sp.]
MSVDPVVGPSGDADTAEGWRQAVLRSIGAMRENLGEEHSLRTMARSAWLSPFHFHRVFHKVTDSTPARFLAAWRMAEAKRLLASGEASVNDICLQIGYSSLGTFTSQFNRMVGVPPARFRRLVQAFAGRPYNDVLWRLREACPPPRRPQLVVSVSGGPGGEVPAAIGLFASGIPQQRPAGCAIVAVPGTATVGDLPDGEYHPLAVCFDASVGVPEALADSDLDRCYVAAADHTVSIVDGVSASRTPVRLRLRVRQPTDPPVVLALPLLAAAEAAVSRRAG